MNVISSTAAAAVKRLCSQEASHAVKIGNVGQKVTCSTQHFYCLLYTLISSSRWLANVQIYVKICMHSLASAAEQPLNTFFKLTEENCMHSLASAAEQPLNTSFKPTEEARQDT